MSDELEEVEPPRRKVPRWQDIAAAAIVFLVILSGVTVVIWQGITISRFQAGDSAQNSIISSQQHDIQKLRDQVYDLGESPVVAAPSPVPTTPKNGANGRDGVDGQDATDDQVYSAVQSYCAVTAFCVGPRGDTGAASTVPGPEGPQGVTGADSTVPGPQGPAGADSTVPGPTGGTGAAGADGQPPFSWAWTSAHGNQYTCNRTDPFDPTAPTYSCALNPEGATQ